MPKAVLAMATMAQCHDLPCRFNRSTQHSGSGGINNDDGLPNTRPIAFSESHRNQLSHNDIFFAAFLPSRNL